MLKSSAIVAAHPDDEILWFSSMMTRVDKIILCFLGSKKKQEIGPARKSSLQNYPISNLISLGIDEPGTFGGADWEEPVLTQYGIAVPNRPESEVGYVNSFNELRLRLIDNLSGVERVYTHNPWGEYGSEEHVQVYRVLKSLQSDLGFELWFSNYCSNKTIKLMLQTIMGCHYNYFTISTDRKLAVEIAEIYQKNGCWTWYSDWRWFDEETFVMDVEKGIHEPEYGHIFPLNLIKVPIFLKKKKSIKEKLSGFMNC